MRLTSCLLTCLVVCACGRAATNPTPDAPPAVAPPPLAPVASLPIPPPAAVTPPIVPPAEAAAVEQEPKKIEHFAGRGILRIADRPKSPVIELELARQDAERQQGLMFRRKMADDHGMLFFMPYDNDWVFYMRNTYLPLDMVFIDRNWRVVGIVENVPPLTEDHRSVAADSRYVLELTAHTAAKLGIHAGTRLQYEPRPDATAP